MRKLKLSQRVKDVAKELGVSEKRMRNFLNTEIMSQEGTTDKHRNGEVQLMVGRYYIDYKVTDNQILVTDIKDWSR